MLRLFKSLIILRADVAGLLLRKEIHSKHTGKIGTVFFFPLFFNIYKQKH